MRKNAVIFPFNAGSAGVAAPLMTPPAAAATVDDVAVAVAVAVASLLGRDGDKDDAANANRAPSRGVLLSRAAVASVEVAVAVRGGDLITSGSEGEVGSVAVGPGGTGARKRKCV